MTAGETIFWMVVGAFLVSIVECYVALREIRACRREFDRGYALGLKHGQARVAEDGIKARAEIGQAFARRAVVYPTKREVH